MVGDQRTCKAKKGNKQPCGATPLRDSDYCFWHDPEHAKEAQEARRLGGLRRRKEHAVAGAFDIDGLENVAQLRRVLKIATLDMLSLENTISRGRALIAVVGAGSKLLEVGELEERIAKLEAAIDEGGRR